MCLNYFKDRAAVYQRIVKATEGKTFNRRRFHCASMESAKAVFMSPALTIGRGMKAPLDKELVPLQVVKGEYLQNTRFQ